jgi:hypothetical protein
MKDVTEGPVEEPRDFADRRLAQGGPDCEGKGHEGGSCPAKANSPAHYSSSPSPLLQDRCERVGPVDMFDDPFRHEIPVEAIGISPDPAEHPRRGRGDDILFLTSLRIADCRIGR